MTKNERATIGEIRKALYYEQYTGKPLPPKKEKEEGSTVKITKILEKAGKHFGDWWFEVAEHSLGMRAMTKVVSFVFSWFFFYLTIVLYFLFSFLNEFLNHGMTGYALFNLVPVICITLVWLLYFLMNTHIQYLTRKKDHIKRGKGTSW